MADYRGGDRHRTSYGDELVKAIREGRTERQRRRDFNERLLFSGAQAGLQGIRAGIGLAEHADTVDGQRRQALKDYIRAPAPDYKPMPASGDDASVPSWLRTGKAEPMAPEPVSTTPNRGYEVPSWVSGKETQEDVGPGVKPDQFALKAMAEQALETPSEYGSTRPKEDEDKYSTWGTSKHGRGMMGSQ